MRIKNILPLLLAGSLMIACTPAKQAGNSFEWGQVPQQPDLSWADSVGSRQLPGDKMIISANSFGAVADSTVLSTEAIQKAIDSCAISGGGTVVLQPGYYQTGALFVKKRRKPADWQRGDSACQPRHSPLSRISFAHSRDRDDMAGSSDQHCRREERCHQRRRYTGLPWKSLLG